MADLLVKLYELPDVHPLVTALHAQGVEVRQPFPTEKHHLSTWVLRHFSESWAAGIELAVGTWPARCYIAVRRTRQQPPGDDPYDLPTEELLGFGCYDVSARGMFGPLGVREDWAAAESGVRCW